MLNYFNNHLVIITLSHIGNPVNHLSEFLHCSPSHTIGQQRQEKRVAIDYIKGLLISRCLFISQLLDFSACRLKKHAYAGLPPRENHASRGKNVRTNTRNPAFPRALTPLFGNGAGAHGIGKISSVLTEIGKFDIILRYDVPIARMIPIIKLTLMYYEKREG